MTAKGVREALILFAAVFVVGTALFIATVVHEEGPDSLTHPDPYGRRFDISRASAP